MTSYNNSIPLSGGIQWKGMTTTHYPPVWQKNAVSRGSQCFFLPSSLKIYRKELNVASVGRPLEQEIPAPETCHSFSGATEGICMTTTGNALTRVRNRNMFNNSNINYRVRSSSTKNIQSLVPYLNDY
jgi:hypothetical protein